MKVKRWTAVLLAVVMVAACLYGCGGSSGEAEKKEEAADGGAAKVVNIAIQPSAAFIPLMIARENGWIEEALKDQGVEVKWNDFESGPPMNESLAAGSSDIGVVGDVPVVSAIAAGQENEIVMTTCDAPESYEFIVSPDSDIKSIKDLKGKVIGTTIGSTAHNLVKKLCDTAGMDVNKDVELMNISAGDAEATLSGGDVDAVAFWEPTPTRMAANGTGKVIADGTDCGLLGVNNMVARKEFAQANPEVMSAIIEQYARGVAALPDLDDETTKKVAEYLMLEPEQVQEVAAKYKYTVVISDEDIENLQDTIKFLVTIGSLEEEYDVSEHVNTDYMDAANIDQYLK